MTGIAFGAACAAGIAFGPPAVVVTGLFAAGLRIGGKVSAVWAIAMLAAAVCGALRSEPAPKTASPAWSDDAEALRGVVVSGPISAERGQRFDLLAGEVRHGRTWESADVVVCITAAELPELRRGDRVYQVVTVQRFEVRRGDSSEAQRVVVEFTAEIAAAVALEAGRGMDDDRAFWIRQAALVLGQHVWNHAEAPAAGRLLVTRLSQDMASAARQKR